MSTKKRGGGLGVEKGRKATRHSSRKKLPKAEPEELQVASTNIRPRACGACTACCTALLITELNLENGVPCLHQRRGTKAASKGGCTIYATRPSECVGYRCQWLDGLFERKDRPDRLGMIVDEGDGRIDYLEATLNAVPIQNAYEKRLSSNRPVVVREARVGAAREKRFKAALKALSNRCVTMFVPFGYNGENADIDAPDDKLVGMVREALATLDAAMYVTWEHEKEGHPEPVEGCSVCDGACICHPNGFLSICTVCQRVMRAALDKAATCTCVESCADDPATACDLSGQMHVHPEVAGEFGPCPVHPNALGDL